MNIASTNVIAKIAAVVAGLGLVATSFASFAPAARAATVDELQAQINALLAQIAGMQGGSTTSGSVTFTMDLTIGSTGAEVTALQNWLISKGFAIPAGATGYFGAQTQSALAAYQAANGISPAAGYFGPITRAKVNASAGGSTGGSTGGSDDGDFSGDEEGYLDEFDQIGSYSSEEVGEDEEDVGVLGVEMEAVDADQKIERVTVVIDNPSDTSEDDLEDFIQDVSLWLNGEEIGRMDVDEGSHDRDDDEYTFRFTGMDGIISEGDVGELVVAVSGVSNLDSGIEGDGWDVTIEADGIRAVSPNGVDDTYDSSAYDEDFTVESFSSANDVELKVTKSSDSPDEGVVVIDNEGDEVVLLEGELKAEGSDITLFELPFAFATSGATLPATLDNVVLEIDGEEFSENVPSSSASTATITFDDLDLTIGEDEEVTFRLVAESATSSVNASQAVTVSAQLTEASIDAEDESGEGLGSGDISGTADGDTQHLFSVVPEIAVVSTDIDENDNGSAPAEAATATIVVDVTARGGTVYLNGDNETTENRRFFVGQVYGSGVTASTTASSTTYSLSGDYTTTNSGSNDEYYTVNEDDTVRITITSIVSQSTVTTGNVLAGLKALLFQYGTSAGGDTTGAAIDLNWTDLTDQTQTGTVSLTNPS